MNARILIVDDDPAIGSLLGHQLRSLGYRVVSVPDGQQALRHLAVDQPDLVLLDVMMPHVSGIEICRQLRSSSSVPVMMLSAMDTAADIAAGMAAGANDYLTKPYRLAQLAARIERLLRKAGPATPPAPASRPAAAQIGQPGGPVRLGDALRAARQCRGLSLYQADRNCNIRWDYLQALEREEWGYLPQHQLYPTLFAYADFLGVDVRAIRQKPRSPLPDLRVQLTAVAAALVLLVLVASLALL